MRSSRLLPLLLAAPLSLALGAIFAWSSSAPAADKPAANETKPVKGAKIVFMIGEDEYQTEKTLPAFAKRELEPKGYQCEFVFAKAEDPNDFAGLEEALKSADLLFVSVRRRTPKTSQLDAVKAHLAAGKPLMGIRTASHAFSLRMGDPPAGYSDWKTFDVDVLGGKYSLHYPNRDGTPVSTLPHSVEHPLLAGVKQNSFVSGGTLYRCGDLGPNAHALLRGTTTDKGQPVEHPVAWTNTYNKSRVFYTSLGYITDFDIPAFNQILVNAISWCLKEDKKVAAADSPHANVTSADRFVINSAVAGTPEIEEIMRKFEGQGEIGDDSLPTSPQDAVKLFQVQGDLEIELVAAEPQVMQPLFMTWDDRGRMWVVQYLQYPFPAGLKVVKYDQYIRAVFDKVPLPPPHGDPGKDKITVFEDTNGDGKYDTSKDVITGLNIATSVAVGGGGIWVLNPPYLLFYPDKNRDDVPDGDPEVHLSGFGLEDTHSVANSLKWGPDGWLYGSNGSTTTGVISSSVTKNVAFQGQMIWRYHPRTHVFEIFAEGGGNTFSLEIDADGRMFSGTNNQATRGMHYAQGGYAKKNWGKHGPLTNEYALGFYDHMNHQGFEERFSQTFSIYEGGSLPATYNHCIISGNALHNRVTVSDMLPETSTYRTVDRSPLVLSADRWFRPVDVEIGPDGAVYLADWYDSRLTHVDPRDNWHKTSGRIYRLKGKGEEPVAPFDLSKRSDDELIALFDHPNKWFRFQAVRLLGERTDPTSLAKLAELVKTRGSATSLEALWAIAWKDKLTDELLLAALEHDDPSVRRWGARLIGDGRIASSYVAEKLASLARTERDSQVRSQLASTAKRLPAAQCLAIVRGLVGHSEDVKDLHIPLLVWWAVESKAESDRDAVLQFFADNSLWHLPLVETALLDRIMQRYALAGSPQDLESCAKLLDLAQNADQKKRLMSGLLAAFRGRRISNVPPSLAAALNEYQQSLGKTDLALGLRLGDKQAIKQALEVVKDPKADLATRLAYVEILGQINRPECVSVLLGLLNETHTPPIQRTALEALAGYDDPAIAARILSAHKSRLSSEQGVQATAQRVLASRAPWALALLKDVDARQIKATSIPLDIIDQMRLHHNADVDKLIVKLWGKVRGASPKEKLKEMEVVRNILKSGKPGVAETGHAIFNQTCAKCHKLFGEGGQAGPDLTGYERTNLDFMLLAMIDPSAAIREEYTTFAVILKDGRSFSGLIDDQDARTLTLRGVDGQATLVDREQIDELHALATSLMPEGQLTKMSEQEVRDLFAYLTSRTPSRTLGPQAQR